MVMDDIYEFYTGHVTEFLGVSRRTIYRWLRNGKIVSFKNISGDHKFTLREINRMRALLGKPELSKEQAWKLWEKMYNG
jgi:hypothetical protein